MMEGFMQISGVGCRHRWKPPLGANELVGLAWSGQPLVPHVLDNGIGFQFGECGGSV
jgi:hypothetical protein